MSVSLIRERTGFLGPTGRVPGLPQRSPSHYNGGSRQEGSETRAHGGGAGQDGGRMAAGRLSRAGGSCPWMLLLLFPSGRRSHLVACPQHPPPPGKDRALDPGEPRAPPPGLAQGAAQGGRAAGEGEPPWPPPIAPPGLAGTSCCCVSSSSRCRVGTQLAEAREAAGTCQGRTGGSLVSKREEPARRLALPAARRGSSPHRSTRHANAPATPLSFP